MPVPLQLPLLVAADCGRGATLGRPGLVPPGRPPSPPPVVVLCVAALTAAAAALIVLETTAVARAALDAAVAGNIVDIATLQRRYFLFRWRTTSVVHSRIFRAGSNPRQICVLVLKAWRETGGVSSKGRCCRFAFGESMSHYRLRIYFAVFSTKMTRSSPCTSRCTRCYTEIQRPS